MTDIEEKILGIREKILTEFSGLEFIEEGHKYFLNGKKLPSVSQVTHRFEPETDWNSVAFNYALKHGHDAQFWLDKWKFNNVRATTTGTLVHAYGESLGWLRNGHPENITPENRCKYVEDKGWLIPTRPKEEAVLKFYDELHPSLRFVLAETKVYSNKGPMSNVKDQFCGTFDLLMHFDGNGDESKEGLVLMDYKTNANLRNDFSREKKKMLLPPFSSMYDEALSLYTLQLSLYSMCLRGIGMNVVACRIIWLKDDGEYELIPITDLSTEKWFRETF